MDTPDDDTIELDLETIKEISFGGAIGILSGFACKKAGLPVILSTACFVLYRGAVFDGHIRTTWSPLAIDDASITRYILQCFIARPAMNHTIHLEFLIFLDLDCNL